MDAHERRRRLEERRRLEDNGVRLCWRRRASLVEYGDTEEGRRFWRTMDYVAGFAFFAVLGALAATEAIVRHPAAFALWVAGHVA